MMSDIVYQRNTLSSLTVLNIVVMLLIDYSTSAKIKKNRKSSEEFLNRIRCRFLRARGTQE